MNSDELTSFLHRASQPHAFASSNAKTMPDGSTTITFDDGDWSFHDNFFGGRPYGGRAVIHYQQKPVWMMIYYGNVIGTSLTPDVVYDFLRLALQHAPADKPFRGPEHFAHGDLEYSNMLTGSIKEYSGQEHIFENGQQVYWATYLGGLVDQQPGVGF